MNTEPGARLEDQLSERFRIRELIDRYHAGVNHRDVDLLASVFAQDAVWEIGPPIGIRFEGHAAVMQGLADSMGRQDLLVQTCSAVDIDMNGDGASVRSTLIEVGREATGGRTWMAALHNFDSVISRDGQWQIAHRSGRLVYEGDITLSGTLLLGSGHP